MFRSLLVLTALAVTATPLLAQFRDPFARPSEYAVPRDFNSNAPLPRERIGGQGDRWSGSSPGQYFSNGFANDEGSDYRPLEDRFRSREAWPEGNSRRSPANWPTRGRTTPRACPLCGGRADDSFPSMQPDRYPGQSRGIRCRFLEDRDRGVQPMMRFIPYGRQVNEGPFWEE